jgi:hypothetical protein
MILLGKLVLVRMGIVQLQAAVPLADIHAMMVLLKVNIRA